MNNYFFVSWPGLAGSVLVVYKAKVFPSAVRTDASKWLGIDGCHIHAVPVNNFQVGLNQWCRFVLRRGKGVTEVCRPVTLDKGT